ncbi:hypothetical protein V7087_15800 [Neobacillus niacini]|uniref:hypothetical protein n=1 Tax=Neobacillus niacini TaxID=86668 RepID=UPI002FFF636A
MDNQNNWIINETRDNIPLPIPSVWGSEFIVGNMVYPGVLKLDSFNRWWCTGQFYWSAYRFAAW